MKRLSGSDWGLLLLRVGFAALLVGLHGWTRLLRAYNYALHGQPWTFVSLVERLGFPFPSVFAVLSALSESVAVVFVALGLFTRPAAAIVAINMAVAFYNEAGKGDPYELPALYLLDALVLIVAGPGRLSLDARRRSDVGRIRK
jgi:putative oxidoreductase